MMTREAKAWGERWIVHRTTAAETSVLFVNKGCRCSWHTHRHKRNTFVVISGDFLVMSDDGDTRLGHGETATVEPGVGHEFRAHADSVVVEIMFVVYDEGDIERRDTGGPIERGTDETAGVGERGENPDGMAAADT